jgi:long-chain acyl-CoA synthetase
LQISDCKTEDELARHPAVIEVLQKRVAQRLADVAGYEQVKKFLVLPRPFTVTAGELTVSLKTRRRVIFDKYRDELEALYREGENVPCR